MLKYKIVTVEQEVLVAIVCDSCGKEYDDIIETQEFHDITFFGGYGSVFGHSIRVTCDLCQHCLYSMIKNFCYFDGEQDKDADGTIL